MIGFADDVVTPPHLGKEVADAIPGGRYQLIADTGHLGFLERPEVVNAASAEVLRQHGFSPTCLIVGLKRATGQIVARLGWTS